MINIFIFIDLSATSPSITTASSCISSRPAIPRGSSQWLPVQGLCTQGLTRWWLWTVRLNNWATGTRVCSLKSVTMTPQTTLRAYRTDCWLKSASQVGAVWFFYFQWLSSIYFHAWILKNLDFFPDQSNYSLALYSCDTVCLCLCVCVCACLVLYLLHSSKKTLSLQSEDFLFVCTFLADALWSAFLCLI